MYKIYIYIYISIYLFTFYIYASLFVFKARDIRPERAQQGIYPLLGPNDS